MQAWGWSGHSVWAQPRFRGLFLVEVFQVFPDEKVKDHKRDNRKRGNQLDSGKKFSQIYHREYSLDNTQCRCNL